MRQTLTWETGHAGGRSPAAVACQKSAMALVLALPVPLLAATGLSLPLPAAAYRIGVAAIERTAAIAQAFPGEDSAPPAPARIVTERPKARAASSRVRAQGDRSVGTRTGAPSHRARSEPQGTVPRHESLRRKAVVRSRLSSGSKASGKRTSHPVAEPEAPTSSTAAPATTTAPVSTPAPAATPRTSTTSATGTSKSGSPTSSETRKTDDAKPDKAAKELAKDARAAEEQAARDAKAAQDEAEKAAKAAQEQALKDAKAAAEQAAKEAKAAKDAVKSAGSGAPAPPALPSAS